MSSDTAFEKHYSIEQLVELWGYSKETIRRLVRLDGGAAKIVGPNGKTTYRIAESMARRIYTKLTAPAKRAPLSLAK